MTFLSIRQDHGLGPEKDRPDLRAGLGRVRRRDVPKPRPVEVRQAVREPGAASLLRYWIRVPVLEPPKGETVLSELELHYRR